MKSVGSVSLTVKIKLLMQFCIIFTGQIYFLPHINFPSGLKKMCDFCSALLESVLLCIHGFTACQFSLFLVDVTKWGFL